MKKGQLISQVFIYILSVAIMAAILVYGYKAVNDFRERSEQVSIVKLRTDLTSSIKTLTKDYGSVKQKEFSLGQFSSICFVESYSTPLTLPPGTNPFIEDSISSGTQENVFLIEESAIGDSFSVFSIAVEPDVLCKPAVGGRVTITMEGMGDHVRIS